MAHPVIRLLKMLVNRPGWTFVGTFQNPPCPPPGFTLETKEDGFLGFVTHYRFVPVEEDSSPTPKVEDPLCHYPACFCAIKCDEGNGYA